MMATTNAFFWVSQSVRRTGNVSDRRLVFRLREHPRKSSHHHHHHHHNGRHGVIDDTRSRRRRFLDRLAFGLKRPRTSHGVSLAAVMKDAVIVGAFGAFQSQGTTFGMIRGQTPILFTAVLFTHTRDLVICEIGTRMGSFCRPLGAFDFFSQLTK